MVSYEQELRRIFGDKFQGCTQAGDELVEYRLQPGQTATAAELVEVNALPKSARQEIDEIKAKIADYGDIKARVEKLEGKV